MRGSALCLIICLMQIFSHVSAEGKYSVIAPGTIHANDKYTAAVSVYHTSAPCQIKVGITGPSYNETKTVEVSDKEVKNVDFEVPELENGNYNLTAEGVNCLGDFKNTTLLTFSKFTTYVRIQTDKGIYKPGDEINYRVIFLDKDLRPAKPEKDAVIWIEDAKRNRIKEIKDFTVTKGVHTGKFQISEYPVEGGWRLGVSNGGRYDRNVYFNVEKYVLPKYVVKAEATESVSVRDGDMQVVVRANYTYGKPLNGKVTMIMNLGSFHDYIRRSDSEGESKQQPPAVIKTAPMVQGKAKIDLNVKEYAAFLPYKNSPTYALIVTTVEEEFTGVKINGTTSTNIFPYRYSMYCHDSCYSFEADKEQKITLKLSYVDGSQLKDTKNPVEITYTEMLRKNHWYRREHAVDENGEKIEEKPTEEPVSKNLTRSFTGYMNETGFVIFPVSLPDLEDHEGYSHFFTMECSYLDEKREVSSLYQHREPKHVEQPKEEEPKDYFRILDKWGYYNSIKLNKPEQFTLNSSEPLSYFEYNVIGRGNILKSGRVDLTDKPKVYNLTLTPEILWAPNFALYVYYVDDDGEYHYAEQRFHMEFELQNEINVTAAEEVKPGQEVALKIKTAPNSFVGLMAVDQSTLLLRSNNDIYGSEFSWVVGSYSTSTPHQGGYSEYPGSTSGCVTLTNADYFYNWTRPEYLNPMPVSAISLDRADVSNAAFHLKTTYAVQQSAVGAAGPAMAESPMSSSSYGGGGGSAIQVRKDFAETWLFADIENTETAEFTWSKKIPDTITSWVLTAFSMNAEKGLGVTKDKTKITTFQPFFISIRLPYSVKRGEVINIPCLVFNYLNKDLDVSVTLDNTDGEFEFTEVNNEVIGDQKRTKMVRVPAASAAGVSFLITPKVLGNIMLKYTAVSPVAGDAIHKTLKVVPEGVTQYANRAYFVNLKDQPEQKSTFDLELPEDIVPGSQHVEVGVVGDMLAPVLKNLDNLVRLPTGCGEQTMSTLLPNYLVMKYLQNSNRLTPSLDTKLRYNMDRGYQHLLNYRHKDGSFSSFGPSSYNDRPRNGSTWLTAYITRSLLQLKEFVNVDDKIVDGGLEYLAKQQAPNGTFTEKGDYFYVSQSNHVSLSSTVLLALLQNETFAAKYSKEIEKAADYIAQNEAETKSLHAQSIATYALNKAKHSSAKEKLSKIRSLAKTDADRMWWSDEERPAHPRWWFYIYSNDVEISSYALLSILIDPSSKVDEIYPVIRWLVAQRNSYGGFGSTQDTVVGLTALIEFAKKANYEPAKMQVDVSSKGENAEKKETINLTEENGILYQTIEMPPKTKTIEYLAKGTGTALVQIAYQYNIVDKDPKPSFTITTTKYDKEDRPSYLSRMVCSKYVGDGKASNMAVLEINTPSGYVVDTDGLKEIKSLERVSNVELKNSDSLLVVYFDHLYKDAEVCFMFEALRTHAVAMQKPAPMVLYDYYEPTKKVTEYYEVHSKLCDICEGEEECSKCK